MCKCIVAILKCQIDRVSYHAYSGRKILIWCPFLKSCPPNCPAERSEASLTSFGKASHEETPRLAALGDMRGAWQTEVALKKS